MDSLTRESDITIFAKADARGSNTPFGIKQADRRGHMYVIGKTGTGKSTLLEAIAVAWGFNPEGGTKNFRFGTRASHWLLHEYLRLVKGVKRPRDGFLSILMAYSNAWIYQITANGLERVSLEETEHYAVARRFLNDPHGQVERVLASESDENKKGELFDEDS